jgi:hypothetical protein
LADIFDKKPDWPDFATIKSDTIYSADASLENALKKAKIQPVLCIFIRCCVDTNIFAAEKESQES